MIRVWMDVVWREPGIIVRNRIFFGKEVSCGMLARSDESEKEAGTASLSIPIAFIAGWEANIDIRITTAEGPKEDTNFRVVLLNILL